MCLCLHVPWMLAELIMHLEMVLKSTWTLVLRSSFVDASSLMPNECRSIARHINSYFAI